jgi:hypothetical protein
MERQLYLQEQLLKVACVLQTAFKGPQGQSLFPQQTMLTSFWAKVLLSASSSDRSQSWVVILWMLSLSPVVVVGCLLVPQSYAGRRAYGSSGAEPECGGPGLTEALRSGMRPDSDATPNKINTIADGLRSSTGVANWEHIKIQDNVEGVFTASERQIKEALRIAIETFGFIIEPSAAVSVTVVLFNTEFHRLIAKEEGNVKVGIVITGGNTSIDDVREIIPGMKLNREQSS